VTAATLGLAEADRFASDLARALSGSARRATA
jgi:mevalonate pyrophosphate decarboxylase